MGLGQFFRNVRSLGSTRLKETEERANTFYQLSGNLSSMMFNWPNLPGNDFNGSALSAMKISTVYTCVLVRGESLATLPASVMQDTKEGSRVAYGSSVYRLIHQKPNPFQTASDFWKTVSAHIDLHGNCFVIITYSGRNQPTRLDIICDPGNVQIQKTDSGECYYEFNGKKYAEYEMLHFKDLSLDGYYGCSKIKMNADTMGYSGKLRAFGRNAIGTKPPGYFSTEATFETVKKQESQLSDSWNGSIADGKNPVLSNGLKYNNLQIAPGDAQYLDAVAFNRDDICGIFRVPPTLVQNYARATFSNAEQQDIVFVKHTMLPLLVSIEQECNAKLFPESNWTSATPYYVKFNVNAFMRGDFATRTNGYKALYQAGLITGNMVADWEDWDHYAGGDDRFIPMNLIKLSKADAFYDKLNVPIDTNVGNAGGADNSPRSNMEIEKLLSEIKKNGFKVNGHA